MIDNLFYIRFSDQSKILSVKRPPRNTPALRAGTLSVNKGLAVDGETVVVRVPLVARHHTLLELGAGAQLAHVLENQRAWRYATTLD